MIKHPLWFSLVSLVAVAASAWIAARVSSGPGNPAPAED
jgi:hypothetical protein